MNFNFLMTDPWAIMATGGSGDEIETDAVPDSYISVGKYWSAAA